MATKVKSQISLDDNIIKDGELEQLLEKRQELKQSVTDYHKADKEAKKKIAGIEAPMPYRVGRFVISKNTIPPKDVSFSTDESIRISIKIIDND